MLVIVNFFAHILLLTHLSVFSMLDINKQFKGEHELGTFESIAEGNDRGVNLLKAVLCTFETFLVYAKDSYALITLELKVALYIYN